MDTSSLELPLLRNPSQIKPESCFSRACRYIFCCNRRVHNYNWKSLDIWKKIREKLSKKAELDHIYTILLDLYSHHHPSLTDIKNCKISPDETSAIRDDLEFYVPQLCNFLLYGSAHEDSEFIRIILDLCSKSFFFSHKILWFINSIDFENISQPNIDVESLKESISKYSAQEVSVYLGNHSKIEEYLENFEFNLEDHERNSQNMQEYRNGGFKGDVDYQYIPLSPFFHGDCKNPYFSTLNFFDVLKEIAFNLLKVPNKLEYLQQELKKINDSLPASVYIPFNTDNTRDFTVLHIPILEALVFSTKERAPFKIAIEVFCPSKEHELSQPKINSPLALTCETSSMLFDFPELLKDTYHYFKPKKWLATVEEEHYRPLSVFSGGVSDVYAWDNENAETFGHESFNDQQKRIKAKSPYGALQTWKLINLIIKCGDDLRQEELAIQLISYFNRIFKEKKIDIWLYPYDIIATHQNCGIIECVNDAISIDGLKKSMPAEKNSLYDYFLSRMGPENSHSFKSAQNEFMKSLAGYSLVCYILQIKDRHNGNILIDSLGHIIHIDFGFMLSNSPGGNLKFEAAPFKLTEDFEKLMGYRRSKLFIKFRSLCVKGYKALMEKTEQISLMVEMMRTGTGSCLPCFSGGEDCVIELKKRLRPQENMGKNSCKQYINELIDESLDNWTTRCYDRFQYCCQGIFY